MSYCLFSMYTTTGKKLRLDNEKRPAYALIPSGDADSEPLRVHVRKASQMRRLEEDYGRVSIEVVDEETGDVERFISNQLNTAHTPGIHQAEKEYGRQAGESFRLLAAQYASPDAAMKVAHAVSTSTDPDAALHAATLASKLIGGGANRWARHLAGPLRSDPQKLADELSVLFTDPAHDTPAGGITVRNLESARFAAGLVAAGRQGATRPSVTPLSSAAWQQADEITAAHHRSEHPWVFSSSTNDPDIITSGYKLHIYCVDSSDVRSAIRRVAGVVTEHNLKFKVASSSYASSPHDQARKGVTIYLPDRDTAGDIAAEVVSEMNGWINADKTPVGDIGLGNGVGLRYELGLDVGCNVDRKTYDNLYKSVSSAYDHHSREHLEEAVAGLQRLCYDLKPEPELLAQHLSQLDLKGETFELSAVRRPDQIVRAIRLATAGVNEQVSPEAYTSMPQHEFDALLSHAEQNDGALPRRPRRRGGLSDRLKGTLGNNLPEPQQ